MRLAGYSAVGSERVDRFLLINAGMEQMAERAGFEPARGVNPYAISSRAHSSTLAPLRATPAIITRVGDGLTGSEGVDSISGLSFGT